jgi:hypothetical protein
MRWTLGLLFALGLLATSAARAEDYSWASRDYDFGRSQLNDFTSRFERDLVNPTNKIIRSKKVTAKPASSATSRDAVTTVSPRTPQGPRDMASGYPAARRAEVEKFFGELLTLFHRVEKTFGLPEYDVATAMAGFLAASYGAYRGQSIPDEHFKPLVVQMRGVLGSQPSFSGVPMADKQSMYEQMAILGMFMSATQMAMRDKADAQMAEKLRAAGKSYIEQFLKTDADRVRISAKGLEID